MDNPGFNHDVTDDHQTADKDTNVIASGKSTKSGISQTIDHQQTSKSVQSDNAVHYHNHTDSKQVLESSKIFAGGSNSKARFYLHSDVNDLSKSTTDQHNRDNDIHSDIVDEEKNMRNVNHVENQNLKNARNNKKINLIEKQNIKSASLPTEHNDKNVQLIKAQISNKNDTLINNKCADVALKKLPKNKNCYTTKLCEHGIVKNGEAITTRAKEQTGQVAVPSKKATSSQNGVGLFGNTYRVYRKDDVIILRPADLLAKQGNDEAEGENLIGNGGSPKILVERTLFTQKTFDEAFEPGSRPSPTIKQRASRKISKYNCSGSCCRDFLFTLFPFLDIMKNYKIKQDLMGDVISGLTVGIMHIPQGMAYGMLTTLPPVYGLYMSFFPVLVYFFFGSSKHISIGTFAVACLMIGTTVQRGYDSWLGGTGGGGAVQLNTTVVNRTVTTSVFNGTGNSSDGGLPPVGPLEDEAMSAEELSVRLSYAMSLTFMVGVIQLFMGITRLGFVTVYLSDPLISGFTTGAACHVFTSQIKHVFGVTTPRYSGVFKLVYTYRDFFKNIPSTNPITVIIAVICMVILYCVSRFINQNPKLKAKMFMPVPTELIVVVLGTLLSYLLKLETKFNVKIVNDIPTGLPLPAPPFEHLGDVIADAFALAIVVFAVSISMAKILAKKNDYEVNANQELVAFGISNIVSSFFASASPSASLSRSLIQERGGGKTQVAGLVSCVLLLVVLLAIGPYFRTLPNCVLAAIIIIALRGMFLQVLDLKKLWSVSLIDFFVWIVAFLATVLLDVDLGLLTAVIFGIITIVARSQRPYVCLLGRIPDTDIYRDINVYSEAKEVEGVKIYRFEYSLFFVNIEHFRTNLYKLTLNPRTLKIAQKKREKRLAKRRLTEEKIKTNADGNMEYEIPHPNENQSPGNENEIKVNVISKPVPCPPDCDFHTIILDCSSWGFVDSMGVKVLSSVIAEYKSVGVRLFLAHCKAGIREMFEKAGLYKTVDRHNVYISLHDAVQHSIYTEETTIELQPMVTDVDEDTPLTTDVDTHENKEEYDEMIRHADSEGLITETQGQGRS